jgi:hypothetical protein
MVVDSDVERCLGLCALLGQENYTTTPLHTLHDLEENILQGGFRVVIFIALSSRPFHPELRESLCDHIYACIHKPYDPRELYYWLKTIFVNEEEWKNSERA